eukprot:272342_1
MAKLSWKHFICLLVAFNITVFWILYDSISSPYFNLYAVEFAEIKDRMYEVKQFEIDFLFENQTETEINMTGFLSFYPNQNLPWCIRHKMDIINQNIFRDYKYKVLSTVKFYIFNELPQNVSYHHCWSIFSEERFQYLYYHPNRVKNITEAEVIIPRVELFMERYYPCLSLPQYRFIKYNVMNETWHWDNMAAEGKSLCGGDRSYEVVSFLKQFSNKIKKEYSNKWILVFIPTRELYWRLRDLDNIILASHSWEIPPRQREVFNDSKNIIMMPPIVNSNKYNQNNTHQRLRNLHSNGYNDICHANDKKYNLTWQGTVGTFPLIREWLRYYADYSIGNVISFNHLDFDYDSLMIYTDFALCPQGMQPFTFRFREIIQASNIPIFIHMELKNYLLPYRKIINWTKLEEDKAIVFIAGEEFVHLSNRSVAQNKTKLNFQTMYLKNLTSRQAICEGHQAMDLLRRTYFDGVHGEMETFLLNVEYIVHTNIEFSLTF